VPQTKKEKKSSRSSEKQFQSREEAREISKNWRENLNKSLMSRVYHVKKEIEFEKEVITLSKTSSSRVQGVERANSWPRNLRGRRKGKSQQRGKLLGGEGVFGKMIVNRGVLGVNGTKRWLSGV